MKYALAIILVAIIVGGAAYTYVKNGEQKNQELELVARKAEAAQKKAEAEKKKAEAEQRKSASDAAAAKAKEAAALSARQERQAAETEAKALAEAKAADAKKAEAEKESALAAARKAESERKTAEAKRAEAAAMAEHAAATNAARQAELETARTAAHMVELDLQKTLAASNVLALQKADYAAKLVEVQQLQEELRRREEETRPNKTLQQLMEQNEAAREAELAELAKKDAQYAEEEAARRRVLREGVPAAPPKPLSPGEKRLVDAEKAVETAAAERWSGEEGRIVARMEALIRQAMADGNEVAAEAYLAALKSLVPSYTGAK